MSKGYPSMIALLGLLAVAGYQNRDKIAEMIGGAEKNPLTPGQGNEQGGLNRVLESLRGTATEAGGLLTGGLSELVDRFKQNGRGEVAQSWVNHGPNKEIAPHELRSALGVDALTELSQRTGLTQDEILGRLSKQLPTAVDQYTPEGRLPA
jgi:uncharacterized protein YidB (DUF937 family)